LWKADLCDLGGQREDDVEVSHRQEVGLTSGKQGARGGTLALRVAPVTTGVIGDTPFSAILAGLDMTVQRGRAAMLDRGHHLEVGQTEMFLMGCTVGRPGNTEDIGDLHRGAHGLVDCLRSGTGAGTAKNTRPLPPLR